MNRWRALHPAVRVVVVLVAVFVVFNVTMELLDSFTSEADRDRSTSDPASTRPDGTSAWVELLRRNGTTVNTTGADRVVGEATTIVALDERLGEEEIRTLAGIVRDGGHLVAGPGVAVAVVALSDGVAPMPGWSSGRELSSVADVAETEGITEIVNLDGGVWDDTGDLEAILEDDDGAAGVAVGAVGAGRIVALADVSVVQNRALGEADNAAFAINLAGGPDVSFVVEESTEATGLGAIPQRWWIALIGAVIAFLLGAIAIGRRIGPPDTPSDRSHPPRHTYAESIGLTLERTRTPGAALAPLQRHLRDGLARRGGLPAGVADDEIRAVARRLGWPEHEIDAVFAPVADATMLALGDALARLTTSDDPRGWRRPQHPGTEPAQATQEGSRR